MGTLTLCYKPDLDEQAQFDVTFAAACLLNDLLALCGDHGISERKAGKIASNFFELYFTHFFGNFDWDAFSQSIYPVLLRAADIVNCCQDAASLQQAERLVQGVYASVQEEVAKAA